MGNEIKRIKSSENKQVKYQGDKPIRHFCEVVTFFERWSFNKHKMYNLLRTFN